MEKFLHAFNAVSGIHYGIFKKLWWKFKDWQLAWEKADALSLLSAGLGEPFIAQLFQARKSFDVDYELEKLWRKDIIVLGRDHPEFPRALLSIPDPPFVLYRKGAPLLNQRPSPYCPQCYEPALGFHIAIVGTRRSTSYGEKIAVTVAEAIAQQNGIVVSGLAFGIDAVAHYGAIRSQKPTIAILATSLMNVTPAAHIGLSEKILACGGTLLSEYAKDDDFYKSRFLERNRLISGLCKATIVIEAGQKSGALITAYRALEQGRDVYALPGDIGRPQAQGCLKLIAEGAYPLISLDHMLENLGFDPVSKKVAHFLAEEKLIIGQLRQGPCSTEELAASLGYPLQKLQVLLSALELKGAIQKNKSFFWEVILH